MGQRVHRMGRSTTKTEAHTRTVLVDNALDSSDFHGLLS
jgi:hypothetical protein